MKKTALVLVILMIAIALLGCSSNKSAQYDTAESYSGPAAAPSAYDGGLAGSGATSNEASGQKYPSATSAPVDPSYGGHKVIRSFEVSLSTDAFDEHLKAITDRAESLGGYVENSSVNGKKPEAYGDRGRTANIVLRVPSDRVDAFITDVKSFGTLTYFHENAEDITDAYFDRETRLSVLNIQRERLTSILVKTDNLADIIELEKEIARVTLEIEQLTSELRRYDGLVEYATVTIGISEETLKSGPAAQKTVGERISEGFTNNLYGLSTALVNFFVWFVSSLPVLIALAIVAAVIIVIARVATRRKRERQAGMPASTGAERREARKRQKAYRATQNSGYKEPFPQQNHTDDGKKDEP